jgi:hypothetical protein
LGVALDTASDRLTATDDGRLSLLGFQSDDRRDVLLAIERVLGEPALLSRVQLFANQLRDRIGDFESEANPFAVPDGYDDLDPEVIDKEWGIGVLPMLALIATADDVAAFHAGRGIDASISEASLSDLGQQAWVHRRTFGSFGLHTYGWMRICWSGALYWLGRLQFNLTRYQDDWIVSTHIPESGPLTPEAAADSFGRARGFFARHFPESPTRLFHCDSWLLDPQLTEVLAPESNMVKFQQLWQLTDYRRVGDSDAIFFVFRRRGDVDHSTLPQDTTLQRAIVQKINSGGHWYVRVGTIEQDRFPIVE